MIKIKIGSLILIKDSVFYGNDCNFENNYYIIIGEDKKINKWIVFSTNFLEFHKYGKQYMNIHIQNGLLEVAVF